MERARGMPVTTFSITTSIACKLILLSLWLGYCQSPFLFAYTAALSNVCVTLQHAHPSCLPSRPDRPCGFRVTSSITEGFAGRAALLSAQPSAPLIPSPHASSFSNRSEQPGTFSGPFPSWTSCVRLVWLIPSQTPHSSSDLSLVVLFQESLLGCPRVSQVPLCPSQPARSHCSIYYTCI